VLDGVGIGMGRRPIIDPLLKDGRLVPLFRDRAIGKAAYFLVRPQGGSRGSHPGAAARKVADWLIEEAAGAADVETIGRRGTRKARGRKA
jgi:DNA-binding transcriptional LysR family regulator